MSALSAASLKYRLTEEERRTFNETGLLYVRNALSPEQVERGAALTKCIHEAKLAEGQDPRKALFYPNFIPDDPYFVRSGRLRARPAQGMGDSGLEHISISRTSDRDAAEWGSAE